MFLFIAYNVLFELFMPDATHYFVMTAKKESLLRYGSLQSHPNQIKQNGRLLSCNSTESIATLPPFGTIERHKWYFQISSQ
jgi:hypothetical protein